MAKKRTIRGKITRVILTTCGIVLLLTATGFITAEFFLFRNTEREQLRTLASILAYNSTASLAFDNPEDATDLLSSLVETSTVSAAAIYNSDGELFALYPTGLDRRILPQVVETYAFTFEGPYLQGAVPISEGSQQLGTLFIRADLSALYKKFYVYAVIAALIICILLFIGYIISRILQHRITNPILSLAETAHIVSSKRDYSIRAVKHDEDELGELTDTFNTMLSEIESQNEILQQNRAHLENILENMGDAFVSFDRSWHYTFVNRKALEMMQKKREDLIGRVLWNVFPDIKGTDFEEKYRFVMTHREAVNFEIYYPIYNMWLRIGVYPIREGIAVFYSDISLSKKAEEEIRLFNLKLEEKVKERTMELDAVNKELESFSYSVSHDLRAPLRSIHGYTNILVEDYAQLIDEDGKKLIETIMRNATKMGNLIDDLLEFSRAGRKEIVKSVCPTKSMVETIWVDLINANQDRSVEFVCADLPDCYGDRSTLTQVWVNLLSNAFKYSRNTEHARIEVNYARNNGEVIYSVKDNGAGFDMAYYGKLFGVFQRLHRQEEFEGTGVGLALTQRIITKHGGRIWAESEPGNGATFSFALPDKPETAKED